eukprot:TRINITY_DN6070_c0_g5_i1.p1 TRINITY_DN6070_c0_g5~~TRINITY_DN6070_c0_g5_i1.p1  ORF type:complete len:732 (+),score=86.72 TRINITY_DN6070_c0_g5_i1:61-2256(+)
MEVPRKRRLPLPSIPELRRKCACPPVPPPPALARKRKAATNFDPQLSIFEKMTFVVLCMAGISLLFICERASREWRLQFEALRDRRSMVPNYDHLWSTHDLVFNWSDASSGQLTPFGRELLHGGQWAEVCSRDSDGDGRTNGEELGDPCCRWQPGRVADGRFVLGRRQEYRRWLLSDPGRMDNLPGPESARSPAHCSQKGGSYDARVYDAQFRDFYYSGLERTDEPLHFDIIQMFCFGIFLVTLLQWCRKKRFHLDLFTYASLGTSIMSFFYLDLFSGVVHIVLDHAPHWLPVIGSVAYGTQLHHHDPTLFLKESFILHVGHVHLLLPLIPVLIFASDGSLFQRLWCFWLAVYAHLFQLTHRWSHMPRDWLPWPLLYAQDMHIFLNPEWHMRHHEDHSINFCFLSGQMGTDELLNLVTKVIPPIRYDLWLTCMLAMLIMPTFADIYFSKPSRQGSCRKHKACTGVLQAMVPLESAKLGLWIIVMDLLFYVLPYPILLGSYCSEFGCFQHGCKMDGCLPSVSATELLFRNSPASHFRYVLSHLVSLVRSPVMAYLLLQAYRHVASCSKRGLHESVVAIGLAFMVALDVGATLVSFDGPMQQLHIKLSVGLFVVWLGGVAPLYAWSLSGTATAARSKGAIWIIWAVLVADALWLATSWFTTFGRAVQWYFFEWLFIVGQAALFATIALTLPDDKNGKSARPALMKPSTEQHNSRTWWELLTSLNGPVTHSVQV